LPDRTVAKAPGRALEHNDRLIALETKWRVIDRESPKPQLLIAAHIPGLGTRGKPYAGIEAALGIETQGLRADHDLGGVVRDSGTRIVHRRECRPAGGIAFRQIAQQTARHT